MVVKIILVMVVVRLIQLIRFKTHWHLGNLVYWDKNKGYAKPDKYGKSGGSMLVKKDEDTYSNGPSAFGEEANSDEVLLHEVQQENERFKEALRKHYTTAQYLKSEQIRLNETDEWFHEQLKKWNADD